MRTSANSNGFCRLDLRWWKDVACDSRYCSSSEKKPLEDRRPCQFRCETNENADLLFQTQVAEGTKNEMMEFMCGWYRWQSFAADLLVEQKSFRDLWQENASDVQANCYEWPIMNVYHWWRERKEALKLNEIYSDHFTLGIEEAYNLFEGVMTQNNCASFASASVPSTMSERDDGSYRFRRVCSSHNQWKVVRTDADENGYCTLNVRWWRDVPCDPLRCSASKTISQKDRRPCQFRCISNSNAELLFRTEIAAGNEKEMRMFVDGWYWWDMFERALLVQNKIYEDVDKLRLWWIRKNVLNFEKTSILLSFLE